MSTPSMPSKSSINCKSSCPKDLLEVYARIRKIAKCSDLSCIKVVNDTKLQLHSLNASNVTECQFSQVFDEDVNQKDLFVKVAKPLVNDLVNGKNGLLFTYGVTNSGKTYTMTGTVKEPGLLPRSLDMIFNSIAGLQTSKYRFVPDERNGFNIQSEAEALLQKQEKDFLPKLEAKPFIKKHAYNNICYKVDHCYSDNIDPDCRYAVFVSYIEIYNENIFDLLGEEIMDTCNKAKVLRSRRLREDDKKNMYVHGATQVQVMTTEEAFSAFQQGQERRRIAHTHLNAMSSRSHSIFNITLVQVPMDPLGEDILLSKTVVCISQLSLVDLAGTERISRTGSRNNQLREAGNINNSLMSLRRCLVQLRKNQKSKSHVMIKYRNSKLTYLFKSYFEGHGKVKMVLCLNPNIEEYEENIHVVQFAEIAQEVKVARSNKVDHASVRRKILAGQLEEKYRSVTPLSSQSSEVASTYSGSSNELATRWEGIDFDFGLFPSVEVDDCSDCDTLPGLIEYLENQIAVTDHFKDSLSSMCSLFRRNVANGTLSNRDLRSRMTEVENELSSNVKEVSKLERQVRKLESKNQVLSKTTQIYEKDKKQLQDQLSDLEMQLKNSLAEKRRVEFKLDEAVSSTKIQAEKVFNKRVRNVQTELEEQLQAKEERLQQLREILSCGATQSSFRPQSFASTVLQFESSLSVAASSKSGHRKRSQSAEPLFPEKKKSKSTASKATSSNMAVPSHQDFGVNVGSSFGERLSVSKSPSEVTAPKQLYPLSDLTSPQKKQEIFCDNGQGDNLSVLKEQENPRSLGCHYVNRNDEHKFRHRPAPPVAPKHRRSCSGNNSNWLAHFPNTTIQPETILQPRIKPNRVVNVPTSKDVASASKYLLTHQCEDTDGELETQLVKGEVIHTRTGGQQVQFIDVETLRQSDPQKQTSSESSKRSGTQAVEDHYTDESSWTDVETRCAIGVGSSFIPTPDS